MPVRCGTNYQKNIKVRWVDKATGREHTKAFHWYGPAEAEVRWLQAVGHQNVRIEVVPYRKRRW